MKLSIHPLARRIGAVALSSLLATAAVADPASRPFKATVSITETVRYTGEPPCFGIGTIQGRGQATHLGRVTVTSTDCFNPLPDGSGAVAFASIYSGADGLVFTAANGDRLYASYSGTVVPQPSGPHRISGDFIITGGTGRFHGATGGGTIGGYEDISQVTSGFGKVTAEGRIVY